MLYLIDRCRNLHKLSWTLLFLGKRIRFKKADERNGGITWKKNSYSILYIYSFLIVFVSLVYEKCLTEVSSSLSKKLQHAWSERVCFTILPNFVNSFMKDFVSYV